jgi:hypothetical protein
MSCHFKNNPCYDLILMPKEKNSLSELHVFNSTEGGMKGKAS